jgi:hypothetical protein
MKHRVGLGIVIALAASVATIGSPVDAKGMSGVTITGAGLGRPIVVDYRTDSVALDRLMAIAPYFADTSTGAPVAARRAIGLGPPLRLTWSVEWETTQRVIQNIYPYAPGGPMVHTPAGQPMFDRKTMSEWYQAGPDVLAALQSVGVPSGGELRAARAIMAFTGPSTLARHAIVLW